VLLCVMEPGTVKEKIKAILPYLYMGILGGGFYIVMLQLLLKLNSHYIKQFINL